METETTEFNARAYQVDLFEHALTENSIIYLPTGSGKTYIAIMLIKELSKDIRKPYNEGGKRTVFIVNTVPLVTQNAEYIARHTGLACKGYFGDMQVDYWTKEIWLQELITYQVLVMTSQILLDIMQHGYLPLNKLNLMIFDECHGAVGDHSMRQIMQSFEFYIKEEHPRILAMSAVLLNSNVSLTKIESKIESLEVTFHAKIITVDSLHSVQNYSTNPNERIVLYKRYTLPSIWQNVVENLDMVIKVLQHTELDIILDNESSEVFKPDSSNTKLKRIIENIMDNISELGFYGIYKQVLLHLIQLESIKKFNNNQQIIYILEYIITEMIKIRKLLNDEMENFTDLEKIYKFSSDKILKLFTVLKEFYNNRSANQKFCCIIFVQRRFVAKVLYHILKNLSTFDENYKFLLPDFIIGSTHNPYKSTREMLCNAKTHKEVLRRFKNGLINCIVATNIVDEGVDIPNCTLIVRFNLAMDFRTYVQSKGRARHSNSQYVMLLDIEDKNYLERHNKFRQTETHLIKVLVGKNNSRKKPDEENIINELYQHKIQPYTVCSNGVQCSVTEKSAIPLINKYCHSLFKSKFVALAPVWKLHTTEDERIKYQVSLQLPNVSPLKEIVCGEYMSSINGAKRVAALATCIKLHKIGELKNDLLPYERNFIRQNEDYLFPNWIEEENTKLPVPGTYKKKRYHKLEYPRALYGAFPSSTKNPLYLHILYMKPTYSAPYDSRNLAFYNILNNNAGYGILTTKKMPQIPSFPIFMNVGELNVDIKVNNKILVNITEQNIKQLRNFHTLIFNHIITAIKHFMVFDKENLDNSFLVVPTNENENIDWDIVQNYQFIKLTATTEPLNMDNYDLSLVAPNYRALPSVYIVTQVCEDLTPKSCFPTDDFHSYVDYYEQRYGLHIRNLEQPMLEVKSISTKINCIRPRSMKPGLSKRKRADLLQDLEEHLVPELCDKVEFPAFYWLKATALPSILHRISQLLIAEDLRYTIALEARLGKCNLSVNEKWPPLIIKNQPIKEQNIPLIEVASEDSVETYQAEPILNGPEIDVLNTEVEKYAWSKEQEPADLDREIEQIQLIDIEYYYQFMTTECKSDKKLVNTNKMIKYECKPNVKIPKLEILHINNLDGPTPIDIMQALTTIYGKDVFNLERHEILGDSFLKFIVSLYLHENFPTFNEGRLTALKGKIIGNRNLYYCGCNKRIPGRMKVDNFVPLSNFIPPAYIVYRPIQKLLLDNEVSPNVLYEFNIPIEERFSGSLLENTLSMMEEKVLLWDAKQSQTGMESYLSVQIIPDKAVADCVEALIGVYVINMGLKGATQLLKWFEILPSTINIDLFLSNSTEKLETYCINSNIELIYADEIEQKLDYKFQDRLYLLQAFTHPSYSASGITQCYERLEFLGDAIIDFLITGYIYENHTNYTPGDLTDLRSALVNNITFACLSVKYGFHTALLSYAPKLNDMIDRFVKFQEERNHIVNDELLWILLEEEECNMAEYVDVPKILGDIFESVIGAIYLDSGKNLVQVWNILYALMHKEIETFSQNIPKQPIRVIYETQGARPRFIVMNAIEGTNTIMVSLEVTIAGKNKIFHGFGSSKKQAKCAAAKQALKYLRCNK